MKEAGIIALVFFLIIGIITPVLAIETNIKETYEPGETAIIKKPTKLGPVLPTVCVTSIYFSSISSPGFNLLVIFFLRIAKT